MKEPDEAQRDDASEASDDGFDSVLRAIAHVSTVDMPSPLAGTGVQPAHQDALSVLAPMPKPGDELDGRYRLTELLGAGGMGVVYAAKNLRTDKEVAIKVLLSQHGGQRLKRERVVRFVREARAAGRIRHPNVVDVYDVEGESDTPYIVMERLHGESLWARIRRGPMPAHEAIEILLAAMRGVAEAHRQGVIHRDLKPDNIFLAEGPGSAAAVPKVLDFGVSRIVAREASDDRRPTTITRTGYVVGTPSYMPLEQLRGDPNVDARADVYALGVILYEALSGARPFEAHNDHDLVVRMVTERPTPLGQRRAGLEPTLEAIVMRALAKEPSARFPDVESFARALTALLAGDLARAREETARGVDGPQNEPTSPPPAAATRRRTLWMAVLVVAVGAFVALGVWSLRAPRSPLPNPPVDVRASTPSSPRSVSSSPRGSDVTAPTALPALTPERAVAPAEHSPSEVNKPVQRKRAAQKPREDRATELLEQDF